MQKTHNNQFHKSDICIFSSLPFMLFYFHCVFNFCFQFSSAVSYHTIYIYIGINFYVTPQKV